MVLMFFLKKSDVFRRALAGITRGYMNTRSPFQNDAFSTLY